MKTENYSLRCVQYISISIKLLLVGNGFQLVRNTRGIDIPSDHHLLLGSIRLKIAPVKAKGWTCKRDLILDSDNTRISS